MFKIKIDEINDFISRLRISSESFPVSNLSQISINSQAMFI